jgi:hypothetical protein
MQRESNFKFKLLHKVEAKDEKILGCESGAPVGTSDGKNRRSKIWRYCPFNTRWVPDDPNYGMANVQLKSPDTQQPWEHFSHSF